MADSLFFLATIIGISWLCLWVMRESNGRRPATRSPFDMRAPTDIAKPAGRGGSRRDRSRHDRP